MKHLNKKEAIILFLGDLFILLDSLWITVFIRHWEINPDLVKGGLFWSFSILSLVWVLSFYIAGLYRKHTLILKNNLPRILLNTQIINVILAVIFFYFIPYLKIAPKTILFIYLIVSFCLIYIWRVFIFGLLRPTKKQNAILIASGSDMQDLVHEVNNNSRYDIRIINVYNLAKEEKITEPNLKNEITNQNASIVLADLKNEKTEYFLPKLYDLIFHKVELIDFYEFYESIFDRIPISSINYSWFIENINAKNKIGYDLFKRFSDIVISLLLFIPSLVLYPFVILAIYLEDQSFPFIVQKRIGKDSKEIKILKFRSMNKSDNGKWISGEGENKVTKVGSFLRKTRIDELPQLMSVIKGDLSLVGPRPDICGIYVDLNQQISYYNIRNVVKPGLSGWAQTHQEVPPNSLEETKIRLSYDLYYIKYRSLILDLKTGLQTLRTLISRTGR